MLRYKFYTLNVYIMSDYSEFFFFHPRFGGLIDYVRKHVYNTSDINAFVQRYRDTSSTSRTTCYIIMYDAE